MVQYYKLREEIKKYLEQGEIVTGIIDLIGVISVTAKEVISERDEGIDHKEKWKMSYYEIKKVIGKYIKERGVRAGLQDILWILLIISLKMEEKENEWRR